MQEGFERPSEEAREAEKFNNEKGTRGWWIKTILLLVLVVFSVVLLFTLGKELSGDEDPQRSFLTLIRGIDYPRLALLAAVVLCYIFVESGKYAYMLKVQTGKFRFRVAVKTMFLGKYYDGITPLSTGGQPFQIYYLHKKQDIPRGAATAIPILRYIVSTAFLSALAIALLIIAPQHIPQNIGVGVITKRLLIVAWVSLPINLCLPTAMILFSVFPNWTKKVILWIVRILHKLRLVKHKYGAIKKILREMTEYSLVLKHFVRELYKYIPLFLLCIVECGLFVTLPFFVVTALVKIEYDFELVVQIACLTMISRYTSLLFPTPGNTGALEAASSIVFATVGGISSVIGWVVLVWRFLTYYIYILSGIGINIFEIIRSAVRKRRAAKK